MDGVIQAPVRHVTGENGPLLSGSDRDGRRSGVVLARLGVGMTNRIVSEFAERPGAGHITASWHGEVDDGVRVPFKMVNQSDSRSTS